MANKIDDSKEMISILERGGLAHLGCYHGGEVYIIPITYVFADGYIYSHSQPGKKIEMMRNNPKVCVQIEEVKDLFDWKSIIAWGAFEELKDLEAAKGMRLLIQSITRSQKVHLPSLEVDFTALLEKAIIFRIKVEKMTGRYEDKIGPAH